MKLYCAPTLASMAQWVHTIRLLKVELAYLLVSSLPPPSLPLIYKSLHTNASSTVEFRYYGPINEFQYSCGSDGTPHLSVTTQLQQ